MLSYVNNVEVLKSKGIDEIVCVFVNDVFVMGVWGKNLGIEGIVWMIGDGNGEFVSVLGLEMDGFKFGLGMCS